MLREFLLDTFNVGCRLINLVDGYNNLSIRRSRMVDCFNRLRHNTVIGRYNQNCDIGSLGTAGTHCCKRFMTWSIQECDLAIIRRNHISTDVLRNAAGFNAGDRRLADIVQQAGLTVVNVAHDNNNRRTLLQVLCNVLGVIEENILFCDLVDTFTGDAEFFSNNRSRLIVKFLVRRRHDTVLHQVHDDLG